GVEARQMQFLVPMICLLSAIGVAWVLRIIPADRWRRLATRAISVGLIVGALMPIPSDVIRPYRFASDRDARDFARSFWPAQARDAEVVCLHWDFAIFARPGLNLKTATYLCNQFIYSPHRQKPLPTDWHAVTSQRPLRCMLYRET